MKHATIICAMITAAPFLFSSQSIAQTNICSFNPAACQQQYNSGGGYYGYQGFNGYGTPSPYPYPQPGYYPGGTPYPAPQPYPQTVQDPQQLQQQQQLVIQPQPQPQIQQAAPVSAQASAQPAAAPVAHYANQDMSRYSPFKWGDNGRPTEIARVARTVGIQAGYADEVIRMTNYLETQPLVDRLNEQYPFETLMLPNNLVPPVISEIHDSAQVKNEKLLYLTIGTYEIARSARLAVRPPTWRDYLILPVRPPQDIRRPEITTSADQDAWDRGFNDGKVIGIAEARAAFDENYNRLDRDYNGMRRYHELAAQGALSLPRVKSRMHSVKLTNGRKRAYVDQQIVTLVVSPLFKAQTAAAYR